ncbi:MAG TPA: F0F1 ATP synthase subunit gamma [Chitinophagaceae bacterium]|nr:F0F1 ATP synthase subunit gamma [Chitinophagaceae bacterium]
MSDTLESLQSKKDTAAELQSVVSTMKAIAAANIGQYEQSVIALKDYYHTVLLGIQAWFTNQYAVTNANTVPVPNSDKIICAVVFGSDQGLVGNFNESLAGYAKQVLGNRAGKKEIWTVGERMNTRITDAELNSTALFTVPNSVNAIAGLVGEILIKIGQYQEGRPKEIFIFYNTPLPGNTYEPKMQRLLPLDEQWEKAVSKRGWPTNNLPGITGNVRVTLSALISEYLFVSLFKACAESLASENSSRLAAMQRAEKNISDMLDDINQEYQLFRQNSIDEELFDVISGFEALKKTRDR